MANNKVVKSKAANNKAVSNKAVSNKAVNNKAVNNKAVSNKAVNNKPNQSPTLILPTASQLDKDTESSTRRPGRSCHPTTRWRATHHW